METTKGTAILIPVRDADERFYATVAEVRATAPNTMVCIVVDGSRHSINRNRLGTPSLVVEFEHNYGKGHALRTGYDHLLEDGYTGVISLDADGQHPPSLIPEFLKTASETSADLVIGNRLSNMSGMPLDRRFSNRISTFLLEILTGTALLDAQCGYRWLRLSRWRELRCDCDRFDFEPQLLLQAAWRKWRLAFVPIPVLYLHSGSSIRRVPDTLRFLRMTGIEIARKLNGRYR